MCQISAIEQCTFFLFLWICWQHCFYILCDQTQQQMHISMSKLEFPVSFDMFPEKSSTCQETFNRFVSRTTSIKKLAWKFSVFEFWHVSVDLHFYIHTISFLLWMKMMYVRPTWLIAQFKNRVTSKKKNIANSNAINNTIV